SGGAFDGLTDLRGTVPQTPVSQNAEADHKIHRVAAPILGAAAASVVAEASGLSSFSSTRASESGQTRAVAETVVAPVVEPVKGPMREPSRQAKPLPNWRHRTGSPGGFRGVAEEPQRQPWRQEPALRPDRPRKNQPIRKWAATGWNPPPLEEATESPRTFRNP